MQEIWKKVKNYEDLYEVSNFGRVRSLGKIVSKNNHGTMCNCFYKPQILSQRYHTAGYLLVNLNRNKNQISYRVHRLVAEAFIPNPDNKPFINHKNGVKDDNRLENLEWCNSSENVIHAYKTELNYHRGQSKPVAKIDDNGRIISVFKNSREAVKSIGKNLDCSRNIRKVCEKGYGHCGNFCWEWISWDDFEKLKHLYGVDKNDL